MSAALTDDLVVAELVVNRRAAELDGNPSETAMYAAGLALYESGCRTAVCMPDGRVLRLPLAVAVTAARLEAENRSEEEWRRELFPLILREWPASKWLAVTALLLTCINEQKEAGLWPWACEEP